MTKSVAVEEATVTETVAARVAPSATAPLAGIIHPGTLLFVTADAGPLARVYAPGLGFVHAERQRLVATPRELAVSHLLQRAKVARRVNDLDEATELLDVARSRYAESPLVGLVAEQVDFFKMRSPAHTHHSRTP